MQNQINLTPVTQLVQQIRSAELTQAKEVKIPIQQARLLSLALTEIMDKMNRDWESIYNELKKASADPSVITVELDGGGFGSSE